MSIALTSYQAIISEYHRIYGTGLREEARWFGTQRLSLAQAVERGALSLAPSERTGALVLHPHQCRLGRERMAAAATVLVDFASELGAAPDFDQLLGRIETRISAMPGIGDLAVYDIAHRLGLYLGLRPERVYLHAGARRGARALGVPPGQRAIELKDLPLDLSRLSPSELEDILCIYADDIAKVCRGRSQTRGRTGPPRCTAAQPVRRCSGSSAFKLRQKGQ